MPDFFDRLVGRSTPDAAGRGVRVRPRLPGPFERIDAFGPGAGPPEPETGHPAAPRPGGAAEPPRPATAAAGDRQPARPALLQVLQVLQTPVAPREPAPPGRPPVPAVPLLVPPRLPPAPASAPPERRAAAPRTDDSADTPPSRPAGRQEPAPQRPSGPSRPAAVPAAARPAPRVAPAAVKDDGRRGRRAPERVVHVSIGRLEVKAADRRPAAPPARTERPGRTGPALSLETYLTREEAQR
ncbi:hypothetical protein OG607_39310 [Streptomyces sp. NBC_01537]|uniref:hypothetical protein n=1 Tax=Streptomyces sp. NBC_01537 TaxID=2903896 RepID=UPI00386DB96B